VVNEEAKKTTPSTAKVATSNGNRPSDTGMYAVCPLRGSVIPVITMLKLKEWIPLTC
jgi:hypothetical protein